MKNSILQHLAPQTLIDLFNEALAGKISVGVDGVTNERFSDNLEQETEIIHRKILNDSYDFSLYKEKLILKGRDSKPRVISIPTNRDKLVLKTLFNFLHDALAEELNDENIQRKISGIVALIRADKYDSFIKLDIRNFYPSVRHDILESILREKIADEVTLKLVDKAIKQTTVAAGEQSTQKYSNQCGVPQGLSISGLLSSIYLSHIDHKHAQQEHFQYYRFVDDILILCNADDIARIHDDIEQDMDSIGLTLHPFGSSSLKSSYGRICDGFQFLGYLFEGKCVSVRPTSVDKIYRGINRVFLEHYKYSKKTKKKDRRRDLYHYLNLKISGCLVDEKQYGWLYFFSYINDQTLLFKLDAHVKRACKRFGVPYKAKKIKKFSRTYYELRKKDSGNYIPRYINSEILTPSSVRALMKLDKSDIESLLTKLDVTTESELINEILRITAQYKMAISYNKKTQEIEAISDVTIEDIQSDIEYY